MSKIKPITVFDTHAIFYSDYCEIKNVVKGEVAIFKIKVNKEITNESGYLDYGVLMTMIDGLSAYSQLFISKIHKKRSLSVNLNLKIFNQLEIGEYEMIIKAFVENKKYTVSKCQILNKEGKLMCIATHIKRNIWSKF